MITVFTDAASSGNPGPSACGIIIRNGTEMTEYAFYLGEYSNHDAEFLAVLRALELCKDRFPNEIISVRSDSKTAVDALDQGYTKNAKFMPYLTAIQSLEEHFSIVFYKWIPEKQNRQADKLARKALHEAH
ncbi:ribonuclease HI family protein [Halobacillus litoralis]|uniref:ribonuclease HI family protein n=1 Tax=Halobacillus litoralis TaxID=45668 RepID=UPI001CD1FDC7|nr:ribonuclease HI family protein [Halobacillus litoralis]MCA0970400.1 ribonuclease HI family protein [Halobacillus litoralis]